MEDWCRAVFSELPNIGIIMRVSGAAGCSVYLPSVGLMSVFAVMSGFCFPGSLAGAQCAARGWLARVHIVRRHGDQ